MICKTDRVKNQVVMDVPFVYVDGKDKLILTSQDLPCELHTDLMGFLRGYLTGFKSLDQMTAQVHALVDGLAAGLGKFNIGCLSGATVGRYQKAPVRLGRIADIINGLFQR